MNALQKVSLRGNGARQILATARANLVGHVSRDDRVAAVLKTARDNIIQFDPKRLASIRAFAPAHEQQLQRQAAAARQERVARVLGEARRTLARTKPQSRMSDKIVRKTTENGRAVPVSPSPGPSRRAEATLPSANEIDNLKYRFEVLREGVAEAVAELIGGLRKELQRENDHLRRELDVIHRELDLLRRTLAGL